MLGTYFVPTQIEQIGNGSMGTEKSLGLSLASYYFTQ